jgi:ABC-type lipoprotein release transport system permease subunit
MMPGMTLQIAFRNFTRNSRRFILLGLSASAGFFFVCTVQSLVAGLSSQINTRGARYYGGHVIISRVQESQPGVTAAAEDRFIREAISRAGIHPAAISHRTHLGSQGIVFANGESVQIRRVIGMDWSTEGAKIRGLQFVSGNPEEMNEPDGVLVSEVTARLLGARVGDQITLQVNRDAGALNTLPLLVKAIFREVSIFGYYTVYMDRGVLNRALGKDIDYSATIGLYLDDYRAAGRIAARLSQALEGRYAAMPVVTFMPEISTMLRALTLVCYGILALLSLVIAVGILNIYRVIIYERTREIGTMRAIGIQRTQVRNIILSEALFLALCSVAAGLAFSILALWAVSQIPLSGASGFDIFLDRGHLSWVLYPDNVAVDAVLIALITLFGALGPARSAQRIEPVVAIRAE